MRHTPYNGFANPVIETGPATDWMILRVKNHLLPCMHNNFMGMFLEMLTDLEHMQLSLEDIPAQLHKYGTPMVRKSFFICDH
jgi:hypothetical protein